MARWEQVEDHRLVQTAVLDHQESEAPVGLPMDESGAQSFRLRNSGRTFWCGTLLGGCGGQLSDKIYREKACHFAHHPSSNGCTRRHGGADSADHLYAGRKLNRWLQGQGWEKRPPRYEGDFAAGGTCVRVLLEEPDGGLPPICVEFSEDLDPYLTRLVRTGEIDRLDWLVRNNPPLTRELIDRNGYALRIRFKDEDLDRGFDIGTMIRDQHVRWNDLSECSFTSDGIRTPVLEDQRRLHLKPGVSEPDPDPVPDPSGRLKALRRLIHEALEKEDPRAAGRAIDIIARRMDAFPQEVRSQLRTDLLELQKVTGRSRPHVRAERLLREWREAANAGRWQHARQVQQELKELLREPGNGLTGEQRRRISSRLGIGAGAPGRPGGAGTASADARVEAAVRDLEAAARGRDRGHIVRCKKRAMALRENRTGEVTAAHRKRLDQAIAVANTALEPSPPPARKKKRSSDRRGDRRPRPDGTPNPGPDTAAAPAPEPAAPDPSSDAEEAMRIRSEEILHELRRAGRTPAPPGAEAARGTGEGSSGTSADAETLRHLAEEINSRRSR
ncbi:hypothetical protein ACFQZ2_02400 [Streptomonospora algeriensis]|uniref:Uncharacterized protein n=1 Tax=Streptomonospora algeriensis TaxID=995084 RepID=A0ABW3B983_9ACTN